MLGCGEARKKKNSGSGADDCLLVRLLVWPLALATKQSSFN